jgi:3'(2'), 5'-bisphosphate nucleotidase
MPHERELEVALQACELARPRILDEYARFQPIPDAEASIKLNIDRESQEILLRHLDAAFPNDSFCAEEDTVTLVRAQREPRNPERVWVVDPIDGTRGFAMKNGEFSVMVGLIDGGQVVLGVVLEPARQRLTYAVRGGGCWRRDPADAAPVRCRVSAVAELAAATLVQSRSSGTGRRNWLAEAMAPARLLQVYSAGVKLALVARGDGDLYANTYRNFRDWDICAGHILVEEAGGKVTTRLGEPVTYGRGGAAQREGLLASNGLVHDAALAAWRLGAET